jgi:hypothetical protein
MNKSGLNVMSLSLITMGVYLIWCGFTDRNPVDVLKSIMTGDYKHIPASGTWGHPLAVGGGTFKPFPESTPTTPPPNDPPGVMV